MAGPRQVLTLGDQLVEAAAYGGRLVRYAVSGVELLAGNENPDQFAFRNALLAPWPNRIVGAHWRWAGEGLQLPANDPGGDAALHGLVFDADWAVGHIEESAISFDHLLEPQPGYPFRLSLSASYRLTNAGLVCSLAAANTGAEAAPVGLGVHPYVAAAGSVDDLLVTIPATTRLETDDHWQEVGRPPVTGTVADFTVARRVGDLTFDAAFTDVIRDEGGRTTARVVRPDGLEVRIWSGPTCRWWLLYTGDTLIEPDYRRSIAVEPMTCPPNAFKTGEVDVLQPGEELRLDWGITVSASALGGTRCP